MDSLLRSVWLSLSHPDSLLEEICVVAGVGDEANDMLLIKE